jgi:hypothetical protein
MANFTETDPDKAAEAVVEDINRYDLSGSKVPRAQSRAFWEAIISSLETQLEAVDVDDDQGSGSDDDDDDDSGDGDSSDGDGDTGDEG